MGTQNTPLLKLPVPDWAEKPDVPKWMMTSFSAAERYAVLNFATEAARDAAIATNQRIEGQLVYTADIDTFKTWTGSVWRIANGLAGAPSHMAYATGTNYPLTANKYKDFLVSIKITQACVALIFARASYTVSDVTPTTYQSGYMSWIKDGDVSSWSSRGLIAYTSRTASGGFELAGVGRWALTPGTHSLGVRITAGGGSATSNVEYVSMNLIRAAANPNSAAGSGAYGDW